MRIGRIAEISRVFAEEGLGLRDETEPPDAERPSTDQKRATRLRRALERLGPTFVKFGQMLATRVDLFSEDFLRELGKLRSHVPPFFSEEARQIIEEDLAQGIDEIFDDFPETPIASASIAQVYRARLRRNGQLVAVKVQRPDLQNSVASDLTLLMEVSRFIDRLVPAYHRSMVHQVAAEYASQARREMDFLAEARAMDRFSEVLGTLPEFRCPRVELDLCTPRVLVMEWFEGKQLEAVPKPGDLVALGFSPRFVAKSMLKLQLGMSYEHGFVHGDTHPGNIILLENGQLGLIDFGLHGFVSRKLCDKMLELLFYQSSAHTDEAVAAFLQIFTPSPGIDLNGFEEELREILKNHKASTARENRLTSQLVKGLRLGARYQLKARSELFIVIRNLTIVEGIVLTYAPELDLVSEVRDILGGILQRRALYSPLRGEYKELLPMLMLTFSQRPQTAERLMRLERSFTDARNLGDFLRKEGVFTGNQPTQSKGQFRALLAALLTGVALLAAWQWLLSNWN